MTFQIQRATRQGVKPFIVFYGESGCGKTYSALLLARGLAGPDGRIVLGDTETGRGSLYADVIPGGYETFQIGVPYSPARHIEALDAIYNSGAAVGILDSGSHEWENTGGVLDMAGENEQRSGKAGLHNWKTPKLEHAKFVLKLLQSPMPIIVCLRAKYKSRQTKENGKTVIVKDDFTSPIQADDFIFEATCHAEIMQDHSLRLTKWSHPSLKTCFPEKGPVGIEHGQKLAQWCASPGQSPKPPEDHEKKNLMNRLWTLTKPIHKGDKPTMRQWLVDEVIIGDSELVSEMSSDRLSKVIDLTETKLKEKMA